MVNITKELIRTNIYDTFYDLITANAMSITNNSTTYTIKTIDMSFNERVINEKSNYPIAIISNISIPTSQWTFGVTEIEGSLDIDVFATSGRASMILSDKITDEIEKKKAELAEFGLKNIDIEGTDEGSVQRGQFSSHFKTLTIKFTYKYLRTKA